MLGCRGRREIVRFLVKVAHPGDAPLAGIILAGRIPERVEIGRPRFIRHQRRDGNAIAAFVVSVGNVQRLVNVSDDVHDLPQRFGAGFRRGGFGTEDLRGLVERPERVGRRRLDKSIARARHVDVMPARPRVAPAAHVVQPDPGGSNGVGTRPQQRQQRVHLLNHLRPELLRGNRVDKDMPPGVPCLG